MTVANLNVVFGEQEEPMVYHIDDVIIPRFNKWDFQKVRTKYSIFIQ